MTDHDVLRRADDAPSRARVRDAGDSPAAPLLDLQRTAGNQAVTALVQRAPKDRPQSTDAPGAKKEGKKGPKGTSPASDFSARIVAIQVVDGKTVITIASGDRDVREGDPGALLNKDGSELDDFVVDSVKGGHCFARLSVTPDQVNGTDLKVIIKASKREVPSPGASEHA